jgi:copper chaperone CopZ
MKKLSLVLSLVLCSLLPSLVWATGKNYEVTFKKGELHCEDCAKTVKDALSKMPDVEKGSVKVTVDKNIATLQIKEGKTVDVAAIKAILKKEGYTVATVEPLK